jgi:hypothetical protein
VKTQYQDKASNSQIRINAMSKFEIQLTAAWEVEADSEDEAIAIAKKKARLTGAKDKEWNSTDLDNPPTSAVSMGRSI